MDLQEWSSDEHLENLEESISLLFYHEVQYVLLFCRRAKLHEAIMLGHRKP